MGMRTYSLKELAELTGIESRTIRSYIAKGLLQGPSTRGRNASYSESHLERLHEIQALKNRGMPLEEIRRSQLHARQRLDPDTRELSSFMMARSIREDEPMELSKSLLDDSDENAPLLRLLRILQSAVRTRAAHRRSRTELWTQVVVTPEIELHVRGELSERERELVRQVADHMRDILLGEDEAPL